MARKDLAQAKDAKKDEFYTQLTDIEKELRHYTEYFRDKVVFCNCDDPYESNFFKYFALMFNKLGLKKLIATCYNGSPVSGNELLLDFGDTVDDPKKIAYKVEITEVIDANGDGAINLADIQYLMQNDKNIISILKGNGDFRSEECIELLKEADIVVTNPPFSLFREYMAQLVKYEKKFLIIGNQNAITYKDVFPLIKENKVWLGKGFTGGAGHFISLYEDYATAGDHKEGMIRVSGVVWFTNMEHGRRHQPLKLMTMADNLKFNKKLKGQTEYYHYDNYDAIEIPFTELIPSDYEGIMGVPITFLDKFSPEQFEILGMESSAGYDPIIVGIPRLKEGDARPAINGKTTYARIFIRKKH